MRGQCCSWPIPPNLFVLKNLHLSSSYVRQSPTTSASSCVWQSTGSACGTRPAPALRVQHARVRKESLMFPYPHRETAEYRVGSKLQDRPDGDVLSLGQYHTAEAGEETRPTRAVDPRGAPHYQLHTPHFIKVLSLFLRHPGALPHGRCHQTSRRMSFGRKMSKGTKGARGPRCSSSNARHCTSHFLSRYFSPLPYLFLPFLMTPQTTCVPMPIPLFVA